MAVELATRVDAAGVLMFGAIDSIPRTAARLFPYAPTSFLTHNRFDSRTKVRALRVPVMMVHAEDDELVPLSVARAMFQEIRAPKRLVTTDGGHHDSGFTGRISEPSSPRSGRRTKNIDREYNRGIMATGSASRRTPLLFVSAAAVCVMFTSAAGRGAAPDRRTGFDGIWNSATATPLERPAALKDKPFFTPQEAADWERQTADRNQEPAPDAKSTGTGTYNTVYREFGTRTVKTLRTSIVTDPADGRIPALTPAAADVKRRRVEAIRGGASAEDLGLQDQCLAFLTAGPPMLPYSYNSNYQILQTKDAFVVHAEMIHDARIIRLDGRPHLPPAIRLWLGDSIGHWEGATLVADTTNFNDAGGFYGDAGGNFGWDRNLHIVERFSLPDANTLLYRFEIDDPTAFTQPWKGELTMTRSPGAIYEYACHEGNYSLSNLLRGYRASER